MSQKLITLIGAGPVGCLLAVHLARKGFEVHIYERRPDLRTAQIPAGRSINLALSFRGIRALQELGIEKEILKQAVPMYGRMMHSPEGELTFQRYGLDDSQYINSISRGELNKALLSYAEKTGGIRLYFEHRLKDYELNSKIVTLVDERSGTEKKFQVQTIIGCDGSASVLRESLKKLSEFKCEEAPLNYGYKELTIPPGEGPQNLMEKNALHIWPRGSHMLIALPNFDGSFTCTLFLPWKGESSFESLSDAKSVKYFFKKNFNDAALKIQNLEDSFFKNPTGHMVTIHASPWYYKDQLLLMGDAAHAIVPFFGQGLNCGFEDCTLLNRFLEKSLDLGTVFSEFYSQRKTDADSIASLALENFVEMRDKVAQPKFLLEKAIEKILMKKFPEIFISRYSLVTFSLAPYRLALEVGKIQDKILNELSKDIHNASDVDLNLAKKLIEAELSPVMKAKEFL